MAIELCPRCKLNYVKPGMKYCKICMNDFKDLEEDDSDVCPMCGENAIEDGEDLCAECLEKRIEMSDYAVDEDNESEEESNDEDMDGMRLVDLEDDDTPEDVKEDFNS